MLFGKLFNLVAVLLFRFGWCVSIVYMKLTYFGHSAFSLNINDKTLVFDPYNPDLLGIPFPRNVEADIVLVSHGDPETSYTEGVLGYTHLINSPGEYEMSDIFIYALPTFHDNVHGERLGKNTVFLVETAQLHVLHLGSLGHELSKETLEKIGRVDVLMVPVGGNYVIDSKTATKVISSLEPGIVVPMHYRMPDSTYTQELASVTTFLEEMGVDKDLKPVNSLTLKSEVPPDAKVVLLKPQH